MLPKGLCRFTRERNSDLVLNFRPFPSVFSEFSRFPKSSENGICFCSCCWWWSVERVICLGKKYLVFIWNPNYYYFLLGHHNLAEVGCAYFFQLNFSIDVLNISISLSIWVSTLLIFLTVRTETGRGKRTRKYNYLIDTLKFQYNHWKSIALFSCLTVY